MIAFGQFDNDFLDEIVFKVAPVFGSSVKIIEGMIDVSDFYDAARRQYNGNSLLKYMEDNYNDPDFKTLGLFRVDIFIPILTYIFGQAFLNGHIGIASLYRLKNERYGMPANEILLRERFIKEIIHELGHTFGLIHCHMPNCVMRSSTYVEDIDQKFHVLCNDCMLKLNEGK